MIDVRAAIEATDTDTLLKVVDGHCSARAWDELISLRVLCREAVTRGKQLWSIDEHIRYRLALEADPPIAAAAVAEGRARFALGPLPEVAAVRHTWAELMPHLPQGPDRAFFAHERVVRGEDLDGADIDVHVVELPLALQPWEPSYPLAEYKSDRAEFPSPEPPTFASETSRQAPRVRDEAEEALASLVDTWVNESNGRVDVSCVEGDALAAIGAVGPTRVGIAAVDARTALAWMGWAAASGGAHGKRRGAAAGRFGAWWAAASLTAMDWPPDPADLGEALDQLVWNLWTDGSSSGWILRLAVEDPSAGLAWAISASDARVG